MKERFARGGSLWIIGRIGILIVFGILPLVRLCDRIKTKPLDEAHRNCMHFYEEAGRYPVLSEGWNTNRALGDYWLGEAKKLHRQIYGRD